MSGIERRLARLEQEASPRETVHVWGDAEPLEDIIAQHFPDGVPPNGVTVIRCRWADEDQAPADSRRWPG